MSKYNATAKGLASLGRNGDTMLMHVNPEEVAGLTALMGSAPTINPETGLPEAFGWGSMISNMLGGVASMITGSALYEPAKEFAKETFGLDDVVDPEAGSWFGLGGSALGGAATNAAVSALGAGLTGGNVGNAVKSGLLVGGAEGLYGGLEADNILGTQTTPGLAQAKQNINQDVGSYTGGIDLNKGVADSYVTPKAGWENPYATASLPSGWEAPYSELEATAAALPTEYSPAKTPSSFTNNLKNAWDRNFTTTQGLKNFVKNYWEPTALGMTAQAGLESSYEDAEKAKEQNLQWWQGLTRAGIRPEDMLYTTTFRPMSGYAEGGAVGYSGQSGVPVTAYIPQSVVDELKESGGIGSLNMAHGGYINTNPFDPDTSYPQSMISKAQPYVAGAPIRNEVVDRYEDGGFVDGEGDGMSDDVEATIDGVEEVRVADGEVIIPKAIVDMFGVDALDNMLKRVRMAAYGTDKQVKQDAGKEVVLDMLE